MPQSENSLSPELLNFIELAGILPQSTSGDATKFKVKVSYRLEKFEGDPPCGWRLGFSWRFPWIAYRESKIPFEVIEGGDDRPTVITHPQQE